MGGAYYNEIDAYAAQWLRNLIAAGHIAAGDVDTRSIVHVRADDLIGYTQCHFFAGLGGWSYAARLAGWSDHRELWSGSCPCQPFSSAGKGRGFDDERHLWPYFRDLIAQRRPAKVVGEQVASSHADPWVDAVHADLEALGYAFGCVPFPAAGIGAPHIRDRNYWLADADFDGLQGGAVEALFGARWRQEGHAPGCSGISLAGGSELRGSVNGYWRIADWLGCRGGKWRPVEPGSFPLAHGVSGRVGRLRAYGNAINAWQAAEFIAALMATRP